MHLPTFPRAMAVTRRVQTDFRGYDHRPGCPEGGIYEMTNGSAADAPLFSTRPGRTLTYPTGGGSPNGLFAGSCGLLWCTGQTLYVNGTPVAGCTLINGPKVFAELGGTVLIWPDKIWYRPDSGQFGSAEPSWSGSVNLQRSDDSSGTRADAIAAEGIDLPFRVGDAVTIRGFSTPEDNGTYIIRDIAGAALVFDPDTFSAAGTTEDITVTRRMPMAMHACTYGNRIWACANDTVWCTKLGDPLSWYWYEADENGTVATAAWSVDVGTPGDFSGCAATGSGVVFLKPDGLWRLYGTKPDNFQLVASAALGTEENSGRTLVTAAVAASQQAGGYYRAMLAGKLPELAQLAYERYSGERKTRLSAIDSLLDAADSRDGVTKAQIAALLDMDDADYDRADSKLQQQAKDAADAKAAADKKAKEEKDAAEKAEKAARSDARRQITLILRNGGTVPDDLWQQSGYSAVTIAAMLRGRKG